MPTLETSELRFQLKGDHIAILSREGDETLLEVRNIGTAGQPETPIDQAYTPFQHYRAAPESRYSVSLIASAVRSVMGDGGINSARVIPDAQFESTDSLGTSSEVLMAKWSVWAASRFLTTNTPI